MRTDDTESMGYKLLVKTRRFIENPVPMRPGASVGRIAGNDYAVNFLVVLVYFVKKLHTGKTRHVKIGDNYCRAGDTADHIEGFALVRIDSYVSKTSFPQAFGKDVGDLGRIIDDDNMV